MVQLLRYAASQPWGASFRDTLPVAGSRRFSLQSLQCGCARTRPLAKTGSLGGVKTLSGYATTDHGEGVAFSILSNNFNLPAKRVTDAIDDIVGVIVNDEPEEEVIVEPLRWGSPAPDLARSRCLPAAHAARARRAVPVRRLAHAFQQIFQDNCIVVLLILLTRIAG